MKFINLCPHAIVLNDGTVFPPSGVVARVSSAHSSFDENGVCTQEFGPVTGLPEGPGGDDFYIVSALVLAAMHKSSLEDGCGAYKLVAPATGHPDCKRDEKGQIVSVPGFVK